MAATGRREFLFGMVSAVGLAAAAGGRILLGGDKGEAMATPAGKTGTVTIVKFSDAGAREGVVHVPKVVKTDEEWKKLLTPEQFAVARRAGTERAFTGALYNLHAHGLYRCVCCGNALYSSETKFDSGTGWPSFWAPIARENVTEHGDATLGMERIEVICTLCDAHLGHVFDDGPRPTGLRYCMNSAALRFVPRP